MVHDRLCHAIASFHSGRNPLTHRVKKSCNLTRKQHPSNTIVNIAAGENMWHKPFIRFRLFINVQIMMFFHIVKKTLVITPYLFIILYRYPPAQGQLILIILLLIYEY